MAQEKIVLITGSNGFIGTALAKRLSGRFRVVGLDRDDPGERVAGVESVLVDLARPESVSSALATVRERHGDRIVSVIHLAAYYSFSGERSPKYREITVEGTRSLLRELRAGFAVEQFVFSSTMLVHAPTRPGLEIDEASPVAPSWPYPESKVEAERVLRDERKRIPAVNLRIAGVYDDYGHSIPLAQHIARIYERQVSAMLFPGDADHGQAFLHLDDLVDAVELVIEKRSTIPENTTLLLGEDKIASYRTLQTKIGLLLHGRPWPTFRVPALVAKAGAFAIERLPYAREPFIKPWMIDYADEHYDLDVSRAEAILGWRPRRNLLAALPRMTAALLADPEGWYRAHRIERPPLRGYAAPTPYAENAYRAAAWIVFFLGAWLFSNPFTLGYARANEFWNDLVAGALVAAIALLTLAPTLRWLRWANCLIAAWVMFAPLAFWSESAAIYSNDTLIAALVLLVSAYTPSRAPESARDDETPEGWTYNPSAWSQRLPILTLAFAGFLLARYLAAFQLGHIPRVWDPFFGDGTERILKSEVSRAFPVSDAGLGAFSYLLDVLSAAIGGRNRWRTMPWMVVLFGVLIVPTGVTSIVLVMLQPIGVGAWCTICLATALIMLAMVPPALDEVLASLQFLRRRARAGDPFWRTFWLGGPGAESPAIVARDGYSAFPAHLLASAAIGGWLMFAPSVLGLSGAAAGNVYIVAALVATCSVIALSEIARVARLGNVVFGAWLAVSAWFLDGMPDAVASLHSVGAGLLLIAFSLPRGKLRDHFGSLDPWTRWSFRHGWPGRDKLRLKHP